MTQSVVDRMARGAVWMVLFKLVERSLGVLSTLILARLLAPSDFGVVAMALSFIFMAEALTAFGFDIALIQAREPSIDDYNTAWTSSFLIGVLIAGLMIFLAPTISNFYNKPEVFWLVITLAFAPLIGGLENIGVVDFRRQLAFRREFQFQVLRKLIGFLVVVPLAFILRNYWALVAGTLAAKTASTLISYIMHPFRPRFTLSRFNTLFRFSRWMLLTSAVGFLKERSSDFFIGKLYGPAALGIYNVSYEIATLPTTELSAPINRALLPGFARLSSADEVSSAYRQSVALLLVGALPAAVGIYSVAPYMVFVLLGSKWMDAVPLISVLAFHGTLLLFHSSSSALLIARGKPEKVAMTSVVYVVTLLTLLLALTTQLGALGAAYAVLATSLITTPIYLWHLQHQLGIPAWTIAKVAGRPLAASGLMYLAVKWMLPPLSPDLDFGRSAAWLLGSIGFGVAAYALILLALWLAVGRPDGAERTLINRLATSLRRGGTGTASST